MCEFCKNIHTTKGGVFGKVIKIKECANPTNLTDCQVTKHAGDDKYALNIYSYGTAMGYIDINYCPICGERLE